MGGDLRVQGPEGRNFRLAKTGNEETPTVSYEDIDRLGKNMAIEYYKAISLAIQEREGNHPEQKEEFDRMGKKAKSIYKGLISRNRTRGPITREEVAHATKALLSIASQLDINVPLPPEHSEEVQGPSQQRVSGEELDEQQVTEPESEQAIAEARADIEEAASDASNDQDAQDDAEMAALLRLKARKDRAKGREGKAKKAEAQAAAFQESAGTAELDEETARDISKLETMVDAHAAGKAAENKPAEPDTTADVKSEDESENADREGNENEASEALRDHEDELILEQAKQSKETLRQAVDKTQEPTDQTAISLRNEIVNKLRSQDPIIDFSSEEIAWLEANVGDAYRYYKEAISKTAGDEPNGRAESQEASATREGELEIAGKKIISGQIWALPQGEITVTEANPLQYEAHGRDIPNDPKQIFTDAKLVYDGKKIGIVHDPKFPEGEDIRKVDIIDEGVKETIEIGQSFEDEGRNYAGTVERILVDKEGRTLLKFVCTGEEKLDSAISKSECFAQFIRDGLLLTDSSPSKTPELAVGQAFYEETNEEMDPDEEIMLVRLEITDIEYTEDGKVKSITYEAETYSDITKLVVKAEQQAAEEEESIEVSKQEYEMTQLEEGEIREIVEKLVLSGDTLNGRELTKEHLEELGLNPKTRIILSGQELFISSNSFELKGRLHGLIYYKDGDDYRAVPFVQSSSQSILRIYPCFTVSEYDHKGRYLGGERVTWFSKGYDEDSLCIPFEAQQFLYDLSDPVQDIGALEADLIMTGTAGAFSTQGEAERKGAEVSGVERTPRTVTDQAHMRMATFRDSPENIRILTEEMSPDFSKMITSWERDDEMYGHVTYELYNSNDEKLNYLFCRDAESRAWIAGIQVADSEKSKIGLNTEWVDGGLLTTPLLEYRDQLQPQQGDYYGNEPDAHGTYDYTFDKFLSKIPVIREYIEHINQRDGVAAPSGKERIVFNRLELDNNGTEINIGDVWKFSSEKGNFSYTIERISEEAGYITITFKNLGSSTYPKHKWKKFFQAATKEVDNA